MADRLYTVDTDTQGKRIFVVFDFEERTVRNQEEDPHPGRMIGINDKAPFFLDCETFWKVALQIAKLDYMNLELARAYAEWM